MTMTETIKINRAPVLTLWAAVVAERLGFDRSTALTLGQAVAGSSASAKGVSLGIIEPKPDLVRDRGDQLHVDLLGRAVPVVRTLDKLRTPEGPRADRHGVVGEVRIQSHDTMAGSRLQGSQPQSVSPEAIRPIVIKPERQSVATGATLGSEALRFRR
jgi:hypothetical protein